MNGQSYQKSTLRVSQTNIGGTVLELVLLFLTGAFAIVLHAKFRTPLHMPGHHGLEFMALMIMAKSASRFSYAGSIASLGVGSMLFIPMLGFKDPFMMMVFMIPGAVLDVLSNKLNSNKKIMFALLIGGISYLCIPMARTIIMFATGFPYGSLIKNLPLAYLSHFVFGIAGSVLGYGIFKATKKLNKK